MKASNVLFGMFLSVCSFVQAQNSGYYAIKRDSITLFVKDTNAYSKEFLNELANWKLAKAYILEDDKILVDSTEEFSAFFTGLKIGERYTYIGKNDEYEIDLTIKRLNYTTIYYDAIIRSEDGREHIKGKAHGGVSLFSEEIDEDDETGVAYACTEYVDNLENPGHAIRIDSEQTTRAKLIVEGNDDVYVDLVSCPTLKVKH